MGENRNKFQSSFYYNILIWEESYKWRLLCPFSIEEVYDTVLDAMKSINASFKKEAITNEI